jgi:DNA topoisomerase-3
MVQTGEMSLEEFVTKQSAWMSKQVERCMGLSLTITGPAASAARKSAPFKKKRKAAPRKTATSNRKRSRQPVSPA